MSNAGFEELVAHLRHLRDMDRLAQEFEKQLEPGRSTPEGRDRFERRLLWALHHREQARKWVDEALGDAWRLREQFTPRQRRRILRHLRPLGLDEVVGRFERDWGSRPRRRWPSIRSNGRPHVEPDRAVFGVSSSVSLSKFRLKLIPRCPPASAGS